MVSEAEYEKIVGNTYFYLDLYKFRQPTFLQRNLRSALKYHKERLERSKTSKRSYIAFQPSVEDSNSRDQQTWRFPSRDILDTLVKGQDPILKIDVKEIRREVPVAGELTAPAPGAGNRVWLFTASCLVNLHIYRDPNVYADSRALQFGDHVIWWDKKWGTIQCFRDEKQETAFSIKLGEPFLVELEHFIALAGKEKTRKKTVPAGHRLALTISFKNSKDARDVISLLRNSDNAPVAVDECYLKVSYDGLPTCPPPARLLTLYVYHIIKWWELIKLHHGIQLEMGWTQALDPPLKMYNRVYRATQISARANAGHQPASEPLQNESQISNGVDVVYVFPENGNTSRRVTLKGFACALCNKRDFLSDEYLRFHLDRTHNRFEFDIKHEGAGNSPTSDNAPNTAMHVHVKLAANGGSDDADADTKSRRPIQWEAPRRPFNIAEFLGGDRSWIAHFHSPAPRKEQRHPRNGILRPIRHQHFPMPAIKQLNRGVRKKYRVPRAPPHITFFRTIPKRPLTEGEMLSESDDEVDETWLKIKHEASIDSMTYLSAQEKRFIKLWDSHFQDEDLSGDRFVPNALLRFVHANRSSLREQRMGMEFLKKAAQLRLDGVISQATIVTCLHIIQAAEDDAPTGNSIGDAASGFKNGVMGKGGDGALAEETSIAAASDS